MKHQKKMDEIGAIKNYYKDDIFRPYGDCLEQKKNNITRLGFQNINGIKGPLEQSLEILEVMDSKDMDIFGVAETNINWTHKAKIKVQLEMRVRFGKGLAVTESIPSTKEGYQPGGTLLEFRGNKLVRIVCKGSDTMGWYSWLKSQGKEK